jgi:hypothetical protein
MSLTITTQDYKRITQELADADAMESAQLMYEFHGPFELEFEDEPDWYKGGR